MRGCLFILVLGAALLFVAAWFGSPFLASTVISTALDNAGYHAASSTVTATSDPPPRLLLGRADRVEIRGTDVDFRTFHAAKLDLILTGVDVVGRTADHISGSIDDAELDSEASEPTIADVVVDGPTDSAGATIVVTGATIERVVMAAFAAKTSTPVTSVRLVEPDVLRITAGGGTLDGHLAVDADGAIAMATPLGSATLFSVDGSVPLTLESVAVDGGDLRIEATLDAERLLGG